MKKVYPVSYKLQKGMNEKLILNIIRRDGPISRADISKKTNLTPPTVTNVINKLVEENLVLEDIMGESSGGRPPSAGQAEP